MKLPDDNQRLGLVFKKTDHLKLSVDNEGKEDVRGKYVNEQRAQTAQLLS